jgi:hypothetical protein
MKKAYRIFPLIALIFVLLSTPLVLRADDKIPTDTSVKYAPVTLNIDLKSHGKEIPANLVLKPEVYAPVTPERKGIFLTKIVNRFYSFSGKWVLKVCV